MQCLWVRNLGGSGSGSLGRQQSWYQLRLQASEGLTGDRGPVPTQCHFQGWQLGWCGGLCSFWYRPLHTETEDPHNMGASSPQSEWSKREQGKSGNAFYELALQATPHHFCRVYCSWRPSPIPCGRRLHKEGVDTRNENHWRPSWKLAIAYGEDFNKRSTPQGSFVLWFWENSAALALLVLNFLFACRECALCLFHPRWH